MGKNKMQTDKVRRKYTIVVAGMGYVGLSIAALLAQQHKVYAVDVILEKVEMVNQKRSPIQDEYIEKYLCEKKLDLTATLDAQFAYSKADFVVIAAPTNYDSQKNFFDTSAVEDVMRQSWKLIQMQLWSLNRQSRLDIRKIFARSTDVKIFVQSGIF